MKKIKVLGVCGAQGALLYPLKELLCANIEPRSVFHMKNEDQWRLNFGKIPFLRSISEYNGPKPDIIIGSPSCGHSSIFSYSRKKTLGKPKEDKTLTLFLDSIEHFKPKIFCLENLPKLMDLIPFEEWENKLKDYKLIVHCHSVIEFGNSQKSRKRLILIGVNKNNKTDKSKYFSKVYRVNTPKLVKELNKLVRKELNYREDSDKKLAMYHFNDKSKKTLTVKEVKQLWRGEFKDKYKWPMIGTKMKTLPGVYRNKDDSYPMTIRPSNRQFNQRGLPMGIEEFRVIMGFPEDYKIFFDKSNKTYYLNKARNTLSKGSVYEVGIWFKNCLYKAYSL